MNEAISQLQIIYKEHPYLMLLLDLVIGVILGAISLIMGNKRGKTKLGVVGFFSILIFSFVWRPLSYLCLAIFLALILRKSPASQNVEQSPSDN